MTRLLILITLFVPPLFAQSPAPLLNTQTDPCTWYTDNLLRVLSAPACVPGGVVSCTDPWLRHGVRLSMEEACAKPVTKRTLAIETEAARVLAPTSMPAAAFYPAVLDTALPSYRLTSGELLSAPWYKFWLVYDDSLPEPKLFLVSDESHILRQWASTDVPLRDRSEVVIPGWYVIPIELGTGADRNENVRLDITVHWPLVCTPQDYPCQSRVVQYRTAPKDVPALPPYMSPSKARAVSK